jgi:orotidine-5'-phosphate decarboxylase
MQDFVNQPHRVDLARSHGLLWEADQVSLLVDFLGKHADGVKVGKEDVAAEGKQRLVELEAVSRSAGDMKFHS